MISVGYRPISWQYVMSSSMWRQIVGSPPWMSIEVLPYLKRRSWQIFLGLLEVHERMLGMVSLDPVEEVAEVAADAARLAEPHDPAPGEEPRGSR